MAHSDLIRLMQAFFLPAAGTLQEVLWRPAVDVYRTPKGDWLVKFELTGVRPEDISLTARGRRLTIRGVRRDCTVEEEARCYVMEINYGRFERGIELPCDLERADIATDFRDGML